jgi:hypothetical protein
MMGPTPLLLQQTVVRSSNTTPTRPQATTSLSQLDTCIATTPPLRVCRLLFGDFNFFSSIVLFDVLTIVLVTDAFFVLHRSNCVHSWCLCAYHQPELVQEVQDCVCVVLLGCLSLIHIVNSYPSSCIVSLFVGYQSSLSLHVLM